MRLIHVKWPPPSPEHSESLLIRNFPRPCSDFVTRITSCSDGHQNWGKAIVVDTWTTLGVFLLGTGAGALLTAIFYSDQIRSLKKLLNANSGQDSRLERGDQDFDGRKSA